MLTCECPKDLESSINLALSVYPEEFSSKGALILAWQSRLDKGGLASSKLTMEEWIEQLPYHLLQRKIRNLIKSEIKESNLEHLAYCNKKWKIKDDVYGVDIIVRWPTKFSEDEQKNNNILVGKRNYLFAIHGKFNNYDYKKGFAPDLMYRWVIGQEIIVMDDRHYVVKEVDYAIANIDRVLVQGEYGVAVKILLSAVNTGIHKAVFKGI